MEKIESIKGLPLTDEQIKSLPGTPIELVPAIEGKRITPFVNEKCDIFGFLIISLNVTSSYTDLS